MAKLVINPNKKVSKINKEIYGHSQNIWEDVSMKGFMWEKIPLLKMSMV